ncbi:MAG: 4-hydroxy-tetrahydrodipicolinate synthase [Desulfobacterales bacterium]|nr:4-hydroxy-tetrahydrodipicolinate synthase [Desulfobacterales bacterium]
MLNGCFTALVTPFAQDLGLDTEGLEKLIEFQVAGGISGVLAAGTTGESCTLDWKDHHQVIARVCEGAKGKCRAIAGTGSNSTHETLQGTEEAARCGADAILLVDPYYNGPSSLEIRREYIEPVAKRFPDLDMIPYVIPGRTGTQLLPEDLAILYKQYPNVRAVKEATGNLDNMARTRSVCGDDYTILSGDDDKTFDMITSDAIRAGGVISGASNVAPQRMQQYVKALLDGDKELAEKLMKGLKPLFGLVTVKTEEESPYGTVTCRARNPLAMKTLMNILGMPSGPCKPPLGKMTLKGVNVVLEAARLAHKLDPEIFVPVADFFGVDIEDRLSNEASWKDLYYAEYC